MREYSVPPIATWSPSRISAVASSAVVRLSTAGRPPALRSARAVSIFGSIFGPISGSIFGSSLREHGDALHQSVPAWTLLGVPSSGSTSVASRYTCSAW